MKKFKFLPIFLSLCMVLSLFAAPFAFADGPQVSAPSAMLLDAESGEVLFEKDADRQVYPASTTKIMTVLLAVEAVERGEISLDDKVTGSKTITYDLSDLGSTAGISPGETLTLEQLLYCAMLSSANEACNIIAEHVSGIIYYFIERMNQRAAELGCTATNFVNTHGLQSSLHYTTARDYSLIALEACRHELFMKLCGTAQYVVPATNYWSERTLKNSNALLTSESMYGSGYVYEGCTGMKTGHTSYAGYCLVSTAQRGDTKLLCLVYGDDSSDACFRDSAALLDWGFENHTAAPEETPEPTPLNYLASVTSAPAASPLSFSGERFDAEIGSKAAVVLDQETGEVFYAANETDIVYPADLTKLMTALLAVESIENGLFSLNTEITVTDNAFSDLTGSSTRMLSAGETLSMESLLYLALLPSADDACNAIGEYVGGDLPAFVKRMNERAAQLGCVCTNFTNTHGAQNEAQYTTAADFALIALEASRHDLLMRFCGTEAAELPETNISPARTVKTTNALISDNSSYGKGYVYDHAAGMKTGYSDAAGYCLAGAARDGASSIGLVSVVFGGVKSSSGISCFRDTVQLCDYIFGNYSYQEILKSTENIASVDIALGSDVDYVNLRPASSISLLLPNDYNRSAFKMELIVYSLQEGKTLTAPISAGEVLGEVSVLRDGRNYGTVKLVASSNVDLSRMQYLKSQLSETLHSTRFKLLFWAVVLLFAAYIAWVIVYRVKRVKYRLAVREVENQRSAAVDVPKAPQEPEIKFFVPESPRPAQAEQKPQAVSPDAAPAAAPSAPVAPAAPTPAKPEYPMPREQADRDYFEEFFRKK